MTVQQMCSASFAFCASCRASDASEYAVGGPRPPTIPHPDVPGQVIAMKKRGPVASVAVEREFRKLEERVAKQENRVCFGIPQHIMVAQPLPGVQARLPAFYPHLQEVAHLHTKGTDLYMSPTIAAENALLIRLCSFFSTVVVFQLGTSCSRSPSACVTGLSIDYLLKTNTLLCENCKWPQFPLQDRAPTHFAFSSILSVWIGQCMSTYRVEHCSSE